MRPGVSAKRPGRASSFLPIAACLSLLANFAFVPRAFPGEYTLQVLASPAPPNSHLSRVVADDSGGVYLSWVRETDGVAGLFIADLNGDEWSEAERIAAGSDWFLNWADYPMLSVNSGNRAAHWLQRSAEGAYDYDVAATFYASATGEWSEPRIIHTDGVGAEHGFVAMLPFNRESTLISWLDGRNTKNQPEPGPMTLRAGVFAAGGKTLREWELDRSVCDCCQTGAAMTVDGPVVVYRDRTGDEIRDIAITRLVDDAWTAPETVHDDNWRVAGCPVNGPAVAAQEKRVAVAWFTAQGESPRVQLAISPDSGATFAEPTLVAGGDTSGRVDSTFLKNGDVVVSWMARSGDAAAIMLSRFGPDAALIDKVKLAATSSSRRSGFPVIESVGNTVYVTWTDISRESQVKVARIRFGSP